MAVAATPGCAASEAVGPATDDAARIIVRFRDSSGDPRDAAFRARLATVAGVARIDFVRAMSGDAFVMRLACGPSVPSPASVPSAEPCAAALDRLRRADAVVDVDVDARERSQR